MPDNKENKHCAEFSSILYLHGQIIDTKEKEHCTTISHNCDIQLVYKLATSVASMSRVTTIQNGLHSAIMPYSSTSSLPRLPASLCCALILPSALTVLTYNHTHDYLDGPFTCRYFAGINQ